MSQFTKRYRLVVLLGLASILALVFVGRWLNATKRGGQGPAEPFRIAGNLYYVGATDAAAFLITGPEGHIVLDGGYPSTAPMTSNRFITAPSSCEEIEGLPEAALDGSLEHQRCRHGILERDAGTVEQCDLVGALAPRSHRRDD